MARLIRNRNLMDYQVVEVLDMNLWEEAVFHAMMDEFDVWTPMEHFADFHKESHVASTPDLFQKKNIK